MIQRRVGHSLAQAWYRAGFLLRSVSLKYAQGGGTLSTSLKGSPSQSSVELPCVLQSKTSVPIPL